MAEPMYRRIAYDLGGQVDSGAIAPGRQLPTELELRTQYDAARNTVRETTRLLASQGLVETRPGLGTFVVRRLEPLVTTRLIAGELRVAPGTQVVSRQRPGPARKASGETIPAGGVRASKGLDALAPHGRRLTAQRAVLVHAIDDQRDRDHAPEQ